MFRFDAHLTVWLHRDAVDFRMSINGLAALVKQSLELDPLNGGVFAFTNRRRDRIKLLVWDRNGFWLLTKRLEWIYQSQYTCAAVALCIVHRRPDDASRTGTKEPFGGPAYGRPSPIHNEGKRISMTSSPYDTGIKNVV